MTCTMFCARVSRREAMPFDDDQRYQSYRLTSYDKHLDEATEGPLSRHRSIPPFSIPKPFIPRPQPPTHHARPSVSEHPTLSSHPLPLNVNPVMSRLNPETSHPPSLPSRDKKPSPFGSSSAHLQLHCDTGKRNPRSDELVAVPLRWPQT